MKRVAALTLPAAILVISVLAMPTAAQTGAFVFNGKAHLYSGFPCTGSNCTGTFSGIARGASILPTNDCATGCPMSASYNYTEPPDMCVAGQPAGHPVAPYGFANGTYTIGSISGDFSWTRVGITAVIVLTHPTGTGVAGFVPPITCAPTDATIAGVAAIV